ncbi:hypothetical protein [Sphingomonas sp. T1]|uniref:hypothetical protein n=1 Tax=Sphingomonas sp. T1 TaxID=2653172 RepID=UPI00135999FD|nr:hypothetical protein [Sphingomonas sp. T1]
MADIRTLTVMTEADAKALGFAGYNDVPHTVIDLPDGAFTVSAKTSDGRRVTFCFMPYGDGPARFVDVQYHERGTSIPNGDGGQSPTFNAFGITREGKHVVDARELTEDTKPSILVLLLDTIEEEHERARVLAGGPKT